jgi:hypothetical protein
VPSFSIHLKMFIACHVEIQQEREDRLDFLWNGGIGFARNGAVLQRTRILKLVCQPGGGHRGPEMLLSDPRTSGGLLMAATAKAVEAIALAMQESGYGLPCAVVGQVMAGRRGMTEPAKACQLKNAQSPGWVTSAWSSSVRLTRSLRSRHSSVVCTLFMPVATMAVGRP